MIKDGEGMRNFKNVDYTFYDVQTVRYMYIVAILSTGNLNSKVQTGKMIYYFILKVVFEGIRGTGARSDIAIDDISVANGACVAHG